MASHCTYHHPFPPSSPLRSFNTNKTSLLASSKRPTSVLLAAISHNTDSRDHYSTFVSEAAKLLGSARFNASKLKVEFLGEEMNNYVGIIPRTYILSHCDFTANLTLTISNVINLEQLKGWYSKDDVVAEWKLVNGEMCLHIHCYVSGPNLLLELAAEFRYHIFSKEMPLVLKAVLHGDSPLFKEHPELSDSLVRVYFHSSLKKYNRIECWGALKDAVEAFNNASVPASAQATYPYLFAVSKYLQPGTFDLVGTIIYEIDNHPCNGTIEVVEAGSLLSIESVSLITLGIVLLFLVGSVICFRFPRIPHTTS